MKECFWRISFHRILCWQSRRSKWSMKMLIRIKRFSFEIFLVFPNIFWIFLIPLKISNLLNILWSVIDSFQVLLLGHALKIKAERKISKRSYDIRIVLTQPTWRAPPPQVVGILPRIGWSSPSASPSSSLSSSSGFSSTNFTGSVSISIKLQRLKLQGLKKSLPAISFYCSCLLWFLLQILCLWVPLPLLSISPSTQGRDEKKEMLVSSVTTSRQVVTIFWKHYKSFIWIIKFF